MSLSLWILNSYYVSIIFSLLILFLETNLKKDNQVPVEDMGVLVFVFIPFVNYFLLIMLLLIAILDIKEYLYQLLIKNLKESIQQDNSHGH